MNTKDYLRRIGIDETDLEPTAENLKFLQRQHLLNVPFENLDIHWKRPILLDTTRFYQKIVGEKRGGFCYELNASFNELLRSLGFQTRIVSARVSIGDGNFTGEYAHLAIVVTIGESEFLADVGFGSFTAAPLRVACDLEQQDDTGAFVVRRSDDGYLEVAKKEDETWRSEYIFKPLGRDLSEFADACVYQQTSPESHFTKNKICSLMTADGRKSLTDTKFIETRNGEKFETEVRSGEEFDQILHREFNIKTGARATGAQPSRLH
jgi:N-hydroxyarylamine O-acetyltransferase